MDREEIKGMATVWTLMFTAAAVGSLVVTSLYAWHLSKTPDPIENPVEAYVVRSEPYVIPDLCGLDVVICPGEAGYDSAVLEGKIRTAAVAAGVDQDVAVAIAQCESSLNPMAINATSGALGLYQFLPSTWAWIEAPSDPLSADASIAAFMEWYPKHPEWWVCE